MRASAELLAGAILAESRSSLIDMASTIPSIRPFEKIERIFFVSMKKKVFPKKKSSFYSFGCTPILQDEKIFLRFRLKFFCNRTHPYSKLKIRNQLHMWAILCTLIAKRGIIRTSALDFQ